MSVAVAFETARADGRAALVGYLPAGFPDVEGGIDALRAMVDAGCDVIEVGLPYSDPVMDGPTIQAAAQQALDRGVRTTDVLRTVEAVAATGTPTVVMTYWNPVERYGVDRFARDLAAAGGAGLITPDLTPDADPLWPAAADAHDLDKVYLVAPSSTDARIAMTVAACRGFVYATAVMGVTGARTTTSELAGPLVARTRTAISHLAGELPVGVGLGVSTGDQAAEVASYADGVIVGSAFVRALLDHPDDRAAGQRALTSLTEESRTAYAVRRAAALLAAAALAVTLAGCGGDDVKAGDLHGTVLDPPFTVSEEALLDTDGNSYSLTADTDKRLTLVFFGYTNCPDICGTVMGNLASAMTRLDSRDRDQVDVVFVTTDPERDTGPVLRRYLDHYDKSFIGVTDDPGRIDAIASVASSVAVGMGEKLPTGGYDVDAHTTQVTAIDSDDEAPMYWSQTTSSKQFADDIHTLLGES